MWRGGWSTPPLTAGSHCREEEDEEEPQKLPCAMNKSVCRRLLNKIRLFPSDLTLLLLELLQATELCMVISLARMWIDGMIRMRQSSSPQERVNGSNKNCGANDVFSFLIGFALGYAVVPWLMISHWLSGMIGTYYMRKKVAAVSIVGSARRRKINGWN